MGFVEEILKAIDERAESLRNNAAEMTEAIDRLNNNLEIMNKQFKSLDTLNTELHNLNKHLESLKKVAETVDELNELSVLMTGEKNGNNKKTNTSKKEG